MELIPSMCGVWDANNKIEIGVTYKHKGLEGYYIGWLDKQTEHAVTLRDVKFIWKDSGKVADRADWMVFPLHAALYIRPASEQDTGQW